MHWDPILLLYGAVFVGALFLTEGVFFLLMDLRGGADAKANRRLRMLSNGEGGRDVMMKLRRKPLDAEEGRAGAWLRSLRPYRRLDEAITHAGLTITTDRLILLMIVAACVASVGFHLILGLSWDKAVALGVGLGTLPPLLFISRMGGRRLGRFQGQLPDVIDMIVRSLRAGHPIGTAIGTVARDMPDPTGSEFGLVFDEMTYGLDLREALTNLGNRVPASDLNYMIVAVRVQYGTGGNLAEVLSALSRVMRERLRMHQKINALSAEGRLSALILTAMPPVMAGLIAAINPDYYPAVMDDPAFPVVFGSGLAGLALGVLVMHRIVNFRV